MIRLEAAQVRRNYTDRAALIPSRALEDIRGNGLHVVELVRPHLPSGSNENSS